MLMAMGILMAMVMGCQSPCRLRDLDAIHYANRKVLMLMLVHPMTYKS